MDHVRTFWVKNVLTYESFSFAVSFDQVFLNEYLYIHTYNSLETTITENKTTQRSIQSQFSHEYHIGNENPFYLCWFCITGPLWN